MAYLGKTPSQAVRSRYYYTASGGETSLSGADNSSNVLTFTDGNYVDVSLNGATLVAGSDYNTTTTNTIGGLAALTASDIVEVLVYDTFSVFSGNVTGDFTVGGTLTAANITNTGNLNFGDNDKAIFGAGSDLQIFHDGSNSIIRDAGTGSLKFQYGTSDGVVFDSSGNVGIGTASPSRQLEIYDDGTNGQAVLAITARNTENSRIMFADPDDNNIGIIDYNHSDDSMRFSVNNSERLRILSTGDICAGNTVANTVSGYNNQPGGGYVASDSHFEFATTSNRSAVEIGRNNINVGEILTFRKQNTTVGDIGVNNGDNLRIQGNSSHSGIEFGTNAIFPHKNSSNVDATIDLGESTLRWKNLYLSGGVYLGGTGSANYLDDYEEGTWLGTLKGVGSDPSSAVQATGTYTKIGRIVHVEIKFSNVSNVGASGNVYVIGIPFTPGTSYASSGNCASYNFDFPNGRTSLSIQAATSGLFPYVSGDSVDWDVLKHAPGTGRYLEISAQYIVA